MANKWWACIALAILCVGSVVGCTDSRPDLDENADYLEGYWRGYYSGFSKGQDQVGEWKVFTDEETYLILLPPEWIDSEDYSPRYIENPNDSAYVAIDYDGECERIGDYVEARLRFLKNPEFVTKSEILSDQEKVHHGLKARVVEYTWDATLGDIVVSQYCKTLVVMAGDGVHEASFGVRQSDRAIYDTTTDRILNGFHPLWVLDPPEPYRER